MSKLLTKFKENFTLRMIVYIVGGIAITAAIFFALISMGYATLMSSNASSYQVTFLGIPIYEIVRSGGKPEGQAVGANMSIIGVAASFCLAIVVELLLAAARKRGKGGRDR